MNKITLITGFLLIIFGLYWFINTPYKYLFESSNILQSGKVAKATHLLEEATKKFPLDTKISFALAKAYLASGGINESSKIALQQNVLNALSKNKDFQDFLVELSEANKNTGNLKLANYFSKFYLDHENPNELSKRAVKNYIRLGKVLSKRSVELWEKAFNIANALKKRELKENIKALLLPKYLQEIEKFREEMSYENALEVLEKADVLGRNSKISYLKALTYSDLKDLESAGNEFEEAIELEPDEDDFKISYANTLKKAASNTKDETKKQEYLEKIKLLLSNSKDNPKVVNILSKIINLNAKYKITNAELKVTMVGDYFYPSLVFKVKPVSEALLKKFKITFLEQNKILDEYEAPITNNELDELIEVICKNPVENENKVNAKLFLNDEFVREYTNK